MVGADLVAGTLATNTGPNGHGFGDFLNNQAVDANHIVAAYGGNKTSGPRDTASALSAHGGACGRMDFETETFIAHAVPFDTTQVTSGSNYSNPKAGDPCHPLAAGAHAPAVAFGWQNAAAQGMAVDTISPTLDKSKHPAALTFQERGREGGRRLEIGGDVAYAMTAPSGGGRAQERNVMQGAAVRRLMPSECEALQGFPQGYTAIPWRGKPASECPDGPRYKALGNSWAVNCARWIGRRIGLVEQINLERAA